MEVLETIFGNVSRLIMIVGGGISTVAFCYAGFMWMLSFGDPQKGSQARSGLIGVVVGLILVGISFLLPQIIGETVVEPVGGQIAGVQTGVSCDNELRNALVFQRNASTPSRMNQVVSRVQSDRPEFCAPELWKPKIGWDDDSVTDNANRAANGECLEMGTGDGQAGSPDAAVGGQVVPAGLRQNNTIDGEVRNASGRDADNNIIVFFPDPDDRPIDSAKCWLYVARANTWSETY